MHSPGASIATHPFVGMAVYAVVIFYTHLTPFMDHMAHDPALMTAEQVAYVAAGWLMLLPLIGQEPIRWQTPYLLRLALLVVAMIPDTFVGIILLQTEKDPFPAYMAMRPSWATSSVHDLQIGGALMWSAGDGLMMCLCIGLVISLIAGGTRDQVLGDWLESVRTSTFEDHVARTGGHLTAGRRATIDDDDDALAAYNAMLGRLSGSVSGPEGHEDDGALIRQPAQRLQDVAIGPGSAARPLEMPAALGAQERAHPGRHPARSPDVCMSRDHEPPIPTRVDQQHLIGMLDVVGQGPPRQPVMGRRTSLRHAVPVDPEVLPQAGDLALGSRSGAASSAADGAGRTTCGRR